MQSVTEKRTVLQIVALAVTCLCATLYTVAFVLRLFWAQSEIPDGLYSTAPTLSFLAYLAAYGLLVARGFRRPRGRVDVLVLAAFAVLLLSQTVALVMQLQEYYFEVYPKYASVVPSTRYLFSLLPSYLVLFLLYGGVVVDALLPRNTRHLCALIPLFILVGYTLPSFLETLQVLTRESYLYSSFIYVPPEQVLSELLLQLGFILLPVCCALLILSRSQAADPAPASESETERPQPLPEPEPEPEDPLLAEVRAAYAQCGTGTSELPAAPVTESEEDS